MAQYPYHLNITTATTSDYGFLGKMKTDGVCILGYADVPPELVGEIYRVKDINEAMNTFQGTDIYTSTCIRGMMEAYNNGAKDIYLYSIAPMSEYFPPGERTGGYWSALMSFYNAALAAITQCDEIDIIVPYDADPDQLDFVTPFSEAMQDAGVDAFKLCIFSYNGDPTVEFDGDSKQIVLVNGTALFSFSNELGNTYTSGLAPTVAGLLSQLETNVPPDNRMIRGTTMFLSDYLGREGYLEDNRVVGFRKTVGYRRRSDGTLKLTAAHTRAEPTSDYTLLFTVHLVQRFLKGVRELDLIGSPALFAEEALKSYFEDFVIMENCKSISSSFKMQRYDLLADVIIHMYEPIGDIAVEVTVGQVY